MAFNAYFERDDGQVFHFGPQGGNHFMMDFFQGMEMELGTVQGFGQVGTSVQTVSVSGRPLTVTGEIYGDIANGKRQLRSVCSPFAKGRLVFNDAYYARAYVKAAPSVSPHRQSGLFSLQFYLPYPFFKTLNTQQERLGELIKGYRLPVNFSAPHHFGIHSTEAYSHVVNDGDVPVSLSVTFRASGSVANPRLVNLVTQERLQVNVNMTTGDTLRLYWSDDGVLQAELTHNLTTTNVIGSVTDDSTLFSLAVGDNPLLATDDNGGVTLEAAVTYEPAVGVLYET